MPPEGSGLVEVITRTVHGRFLLAPSEELNDLILGALSRAQYREQIAILVAGIEARAAESPAPLFHAASKKVRIELYRAYGEFLGAFRTAAEKLKAGMRDVVFPSGSFPPALPWVSG